jgi:transcriptional regulator of aromatic amino acid metabolism
VLLHRAGGVFSLGIPGMRRQVRSAKKIWSIFVQSAQQQHGTHEGELHDALVLFLSGYAGLAVASD